MTRFNTKLILRRNILCFNNLQNKTSTHFYFTLQLHFAFNPSSSFDDALKCGCSSLLRRTSPTHADILHYTHTRWSTSSIHTLGSQTLPTFLSSSLVFSTCFFTGLHTSMSVDFFTGLHTSMSVDFLTGLHTPMDYTPDFKQYNPN